jgi:hypothetical protein
MDELIVGDLVKIMNKDFWNVTAVVTKTWSSASGKRMIEVLVKNEKLAIIRASDVIVLSLKC